MLWAKRARGGIFVMRLRTAIAQRTYVDDDECTGSDVAMALPSICSASESESGRLIMREIRLASRAPAIRLSTIACPSTISITMMNAVSGACVTAARKPPIPRAINGGPRSLLTIYPTALPMSALIDGESAKMPPGTPHQAVSQVAMNLSTERVPVDGGVGR